MNVISYYNKKVGFWMPPVCDNRAVNVITTEQYRAIMVNPKKAQENHFEELELYFLGEFDDLSGTFKLFDKPQKILDCQDIMYQALEKKVEKEGGLKDE